MVLEEVQELFSMSPPCVSSPGKGPGVYPGIPFVLEKYAPFV
ncbi:hypothetical protein Holit_01185 [Hollandina sp. SP2]